MAASRLTRPLDYVHDVLGLRLSSGDFAIDATAGNGHDTLFLARCVAPAGHVLAVDVQARAVERTRERLREAGLEQSVDVVEGSHADLGRLTAPDRRGKVRAVMFNLGFLPGSDKDVITQPQTTIAALEAAADLLAPGGLLSIVVYSGHDGGAAEAAAVLAWCESRDAGRWHVVQYRQLNRPNNPPWAIIAEKMAESEKAIGRTKGND